ncbi:MAG: helix-turn-helix domain-containing protein [Lachnospiraceae bacterium]|nr:helix-turn-helix domain-containing protein [Lachnospiraceae bacterium]
MTVGENIRRIRKEKGMTIKELAEIVGISDTYMRFYENGQRFPKKDAMKRIADALGVNQEVFLNAETDPVTSMHRLFQIFKQYPGKICSAEEVNKGVRTNKIEKNEMFISFSGFSALVRSWHDEYVTYMNEIAEAEKISDPVGKANAILEAQKKFDNWMDFYPETEPDQKMLKLLMKANEAHDHMALNPLNNPEPSATKSQKSKSDKSVTSRKPNTRKKK